MSRHHDWQDRLAEYLAAHEGQPFDWVSNSCLTFVTGAVTAMTGLDPWPVDRARIAGLQGRERVQEYMMEYGGGLQGAAARALAKAGLAPVMDPCEGDIVLAVVGNSEALGVCTGRQCAFLTRTGLVLKQPTAILHAWGLRP